MLSNIFSCKTFVLIQPRTSPPKICKNLQNSANFATADHDVLCQPMTRSKSVLLSLSVIGLVLQSLKGSTVANFGKLFANFRSFSPVSAPIFANKYAFCRIFQNLQDYLADFFEKWQNFADFAKLLLNFHENCRFFKPIVC